MRQGSLQAPAANYPLEFLIRDNLMAAPAQSGDIYARWLGITETARPLNHYQLLRLKNFEDDAGQIRAHYNKMSAHVRK